MSDRQEDYSDDFKLQAVRMCEPTAHSIAEVARLLGIDPRDLAMWHVQYGYESDEQYPRSVITRLEEELRRLQAQNAALRAERDHLRKAVSFASAAFREQAGAADS